MKLHGHARVELTNIHTGQKEIVEKDNIITNAVSEIFNGFGGSMNWQQLVGFGDTRWSDGPKDLLSMFYGGLLLYDTALGTDPATCFAPADAAIVGTAVSQTVNSGVNTVRGSCNMTETKLDFDEGVATYVYDFTTSQGNGVIASVCLTSPTGGYFSETAGTTPCTYTYAYLMDMNGVMGGASRILTGADATSLYAIGCSTGVALYADPENDVLVCGKLTTGTNPTLELRSYALNLHSLSLFCRNASGTLNSLVSAKTLALDSCLLTSDDNKNRLCCDPELRKIYLVSAPSSFTVDASCSVREYDIDTLEAVDYVITNNTGVTLQHIVSSGVNAKLNGTVYGGWIYFADQSTGKRIFRIKLSDPTVVEEITVNDRSMSFVSDMHDGRMYCYSNTAPVVLNTQSKTLLGIEAAGRESGDAHTVTVPVLGEPVTPLLRYWDVNICRFYTTRVMRCNYLATINDLPEAVEKTADKTMKITYTLRKGA